MNGLEWTYWNTYPPGAKRVESEMAILFTTTSHFETGVVERCVKRLSSNCINVKASS